MTIPEIERLIDQVYENVGAKYSDTFKTILGGCSCTPPTEWLGDTALAFKKVLSKNAIADSELKAKVQSYISNWE